MTWEEPTFESLNRHAIHDVNEKRRMESLNNPHRYNCEYCNDTGYILTQDDDGDCIYKRCSCYSKIIAGRIAKSSGFGFMLDHFTFSNFNTNAKYQAQMLQIAKSFCEDDNANWFFLGGQSGSGKTHLCTAISKFYIDFGRQTKYICWNTFSSELKRLFNDSEKYNRKIEEVENIDVLFIDDLFKNAKGAQPTDADIRLAFEIINSRFLSSNKVTIISSEWFLSDLLKIDEATFSRVHQRCGDYKLDISRDTSRNFRLK